MSGLFRSYVSRGGYLDYYLEEGRRAYWAVSELDLSLYRTGFPVPGTVEEVRILLRSPGLPA